MKHILWLDSGVVREKGGLQNHKPVLIKVYLREKDIHVKFTLTGSLCEAEKYLSQLTKLDLLIVNISLNSFDCPNYNLRDGRIARIAGMLFILLNIKKILDDQLPILIYASRVEEERNSGQFKFIEDLLPSVSFLDRNSSAFELSEKIAEIFAKDKK